MRKINILDGQDQIEGFARKVLERSESTKYRADEPELRKDFVSYLAAKVNEAKTKVLKSMEHVQSLEEYRLNNLKDRSLKTSQRKAINNQCRFSRSEHRTVN